MEEGDASVEEVALVLEDIMRKRLSGGWEYASFDGIKTLIVDSDGARTLHIRGAFYVLGGGSRGPDGPPDASYGSRLVGWSRARCPS